MKQFALKLVHGVLLLKTSHSIEIKLSLEIEIILEFINNQVFYRTVPSVIS